MTIDPGMDPHPVGRHPTSATRAPSLRGARRFPVATACALASAVAIGGCTNPFSPEGTDPGVYKGQSDPLFEEPAEARDAALRERFELIQRR